MEVKQKDKGMCHGDVRVFYILQRMQCDTFLSTAAIEKRHSQKSIIATRPFEPRCFFTLTLRFPPLPMVACERTIFHVEPHYRYVR